MKEIEDMLNHLNKLFKALEKSTEFSDEPLPVEFCSEITCMGKPDEMVELIKAGYAGLLNAAMVTAIVGNSKGDIASKRIPMVQLSRDKHGCVMCKNGKCLLWESGLTPIMGKLLLLKGKSMGVKAKKFLIHMTILEWLDPANDSDIHFCLKHLEQLNKKSGSNQTN